MSSIPEPSGTPALAGEAADLLCGGCGYDLRGIDSGRCPECGRRFDLHRLMSEQMPWEQRRHIGRIRAYWRTVWLVTLHPGRAGVMVRNPVSLKDAQRFRWITLLLAFVPLIATADLWMGEWQRAAWDDTDRHSVWEPVKVVGRVCLGWPEDRWPGLITQAGLLVGLVLTAGLPGSFCRARRLSVTAQRRALAIAQYACGPLAWVPVGLLVVGAAIGLGDASEVPGDPIGEAILGTVYSVAMAVPCAIPVLWWIASLGLVRKATGCGIGRVIGVGVAWPLVGVLVTAFCVAVLHLAVSFAVLVIVG